MGELDANKVRITTSLLFDPKKKAFLKNRSIEVDTKNGSIIAVIERKSSDPIHADDIDLSGKVVMPG